MRQYNQPLDTGNPLAVGTLPENQAVEETLALNGGLTTPSNDKLPTDTPVSNDGGVNFNDQLVGDSLAANTGSNQPLNEPLGEVFALNAGGAMNNQPSVEATLLNEGNILDSHSSDELFIGDKENDPNGDSGSAFNPPDPCNPGYQQSAKLRARYDCEKKPKKPKKPSDTPSQGFGPNIPAKESFPRPETRLKIPVFGPGFRGNNDECFRYTFGLLPLGVCDSEQPNKRFFSTYTYHGAHFFRLEDADLGKSLSLSCFFTMLYLSDCED